MVIFHQACTPRGEGVTTDLFPASKALHPHEVRHIVKGLFCIDHRSATQIFMVGIQNAFSVTGRLHPKADDFLRIRKVRMCNDHFSL